MRTSDKPGLTQVCFFVRNFGLRFSNYVFGFGNMTILVLLQTINFFNMGPKLNLVDLPGYGFAYAKEEVKDAWEELVSAKNKS